MTGASRPIQSWTGLTVGETFGPYRYVVEAYIARAYRRAIGDFELEAIDGEEVAPLTILTSPFLQLIESKYVPWPGGIHAQQDLELLAPVRVGALLTVTGVLTKMELKRGRRYFTVDGSAVDERGVVVATSRTVGIHGDRYSTQGDGSA